MIDLKKQKHILISRTDNIGDVVLTLPMVAILKQENPALKISLLVRDYARPVVELSPFVDQIISWDTLSKLPLQQAIEALKAARIDCVIHVYPKSTIAQLMKAAKIPYRIGTSHRLYHWLYCNKLVHFSRAKSSLHEAQLNLKLLKPFGVEADYSLEQLKLYGRLKNKAALPERLRNFYRDDKFNLIIHPFTNGHTREWPAHAFAKLIAALPSEQFNILITGSDEERGRIHSAITIKRPNVINLAGQCSLAELSQVIASADGLVANSTGPLHMAASLGVRTLGLFPISSNIGPVRWAPIGEKTEVLTADPNCQSPRCYKHSDCFCMESIQVDDVKNVLMGWL